ncbi:MAG: substrate-binding domain-containing protein, partial [Anaerolineales bacterium]|nr:substrate-binding domain-containing protein [Anaerolineales bacterium]
MLHKSNVLFAVLIIATLILSACASTTPTEAPAVEPTEPPVVEPTQAPTEEPVVEPTEAPAVDMVVLPEVDPAAVSGEITIAGSSTVYPLAEAMAERFNDEGFGGQITIASVGSGAGFERFCATGETDIANASRGIKDEEVANCAAIGRTPIEFRVGTDALAIVVSSENDFLTDVTLEELA